MAYINSDVNIVILIWQDTVSETELQFQVPHGFLQYFLRIRNSFLKCHFPWTFVILNQTFRNIVSKNTAADRSFLILIQDMDDLNVNHLPCRVHSPTNALFNLKSTLKFTLKYTYISLLHVSAFDHHQGVCTEPG